MQMEIVESYIVRNPGTPEAYIDPKSWSYIKWLRDYSKSEHYTDMPIPLFVIPMDIAIEEGINMRSDAYISRVIRWECERMNSSLGRQAYTESDIQNAQTLSINFFNLERINL